MVDKKSMVYEGIEVAIEVIFQTMRFSKMKNKNSMSEETTLSSVEVTA